MCDSGELARLQGELRELREQSYDAEYWKARMEANFVDMIRVSVQLERATIERDKLQADLAASQQQVAALREALELCDSDGHRQAITAPEDAMIERLCEQIGYGVALDGVARMWRKKHGTAACTAGPPVMVVEQALALTPDAGQRVQKLERVAEAAREVGQKCTMILCHPKKQSVDFCGDAEECPLEKLTLGLAELDK